MLFISPTLPNRLELSLRTVRALPDVLAVVGGIGVWGVLEWGVSFRDKAKKRRKDESEKGEGEAEETGKKKKEWCTPD